MKTRVEVAVDLGLTFHDQEDMTITELEQVYNGLYDRLLTYWNGPKSERDWVVTQLNLVHDTIKARSL